MDREHSKQVKLANKQMRGLGDTLDHGATAFKVFDNRENTKVKTGELRNLVKGDDKNDPLLTVTHKKAPLKEAMEVLETVFSQIEKVHGDPVWRNTRVGFVPMNKSAELQDKADKNAYDEFQQARKRENKSEEELDKKRNETKNNPLEEDMKVLEELIGEGRNLEDVVVRGYNKGKVPLDDLQKLMDKAHEVPSDSSYFHKSKGEKGELRTKHRHMDYERNVLSDGWGKDDNKKIEASIKRKAKNDKSFPVFQALKAYKEGKADIKEALEIMEDIWSKIQEQPSDKKEELTRMYYKMKQKEGKTTSDIIDDRKKHMTKQEKGQEKTKERNQKAWKNYLDAVRDYTENTPSMYQFEALEKALSLTEEIINEVSVGALARAVENNLPKRKKNEEVAIKAYKQAQNEYEKGSKESPEDEPALYKKLQCTDKAACKEFDKARDAENLKDLNLPKDSKVSANKLFNAAKKVNPERQKKTEETVKNTKGTKEDAKKFLNSLKRDNRSFDISLADPVKSRNEAN